MSKKKRKGKAVGRPPRPLPDQIPDTPENVARAILSAKPKKKGDWDYLRKGESD